MDENVAKMKDQLNTINETASESIKEIRNIAHHLHPNLLDKVGLSKTLQAMVHKIEGTSSVSFSMTFDDIDNVFAIENEVNIYRIVQEGINNIVKHAEAKYASISVMKDDKTVSIFIQDDGKGIDPMKALKDNSSNEGFGLRSLNERVKYLNGEVVLDSKTGVGTRLTITIPIKGNEKIN